MAPPRCDIVSAMLRRTFRLPDPANRCVRMVPAAFIAALIGSTSMALAQEHVTVRSDILFYGDNTEFRNPFREGETIFGAAPRMEIVFGLNDRVEVAVGAFANVRFGGDQAFEDGKPIVALRITGNRSTFVFGTLPSPSPCIGPDRGGPHGLLPPLQGETLAFDRPYEAGISWAIKGRNYQHDTWLNWQRVNTREHRERFDAGASGSLQLGSWLAVPFQLHVVHEGGQLFASGPVADSFAAAAGFRVHGRHELFENLGIETYGIASRFVPDRGQPLRSRDGGGFLGRASAERGGWRGHLLVWRGKNFVKDEGDPNYSSLRRDGTPHGGTRDYAEAGLTRAFRPARDVILEVSGRAHRVERHYEYSFRIVARAAVKVRLR